jgi:hypothetical protein
MLPIFQPSIVRWPELFDFHARLGWTVKSNFSGHCLEERDDVFRVSTGPDGWPGTRTISESRVVVIGDSHAFGYGVDTHRAFFAINPEVPIKAVGAPGYNMVQEILVMKELAPSLKGKTVVWFVYFGNDLYDNLSPEMDGYRTPFVTQDIGGNWAIMTKHLHPSKWSCSAGRQGRQRFRIPERLFRKSFLADRAFSACEFLIARGRDICDRASAELIIVTIPTAAMLEPSPSVHGESIDAEYPDKQIRVICEKLGVRLVCLKDVLTRNDYKRWDEHWNERGHRKVARAISALCRDKAESETGMEGATSSLKQTAISRTSLTH